MTQNERETLVRSYLGKTVTVEIDRPIGYIHKKEKYTLVYPINYGYIPGVLGGDGEELDVYVLGFDKPMERCEVRIVGIAFRADDVEDKLIGAPVGCLPDQAEIAQAIAFQERYYRTTVEALFQRSAGVILSQNGTYLLMHQRRSRTWSFPKGHIEPCETERQAAIREVKEETGFDVVPEEGFRAVVEYPMAHGKNKQVILFRATVCGEPVIPSDEIAEYRWVTLSEAKELLGSAYAELLSRL